MISIKRILYLFAIIALLAMSPGGGADQANFPDIYIDGASGGDGSLATPYSDFASINWTTGGDNSVYDAVAAGKDVTINLKRGVTWYEVLKVGTSGSAAHPIIIQAYGEGADPIIDGSDAATTWANTSDEIYEKTFTFAPAVVLEDGALLTFVVWDTDIATTYLNMSTATYTVDSANKIAYVWCTDDADPDTHTMRVAAKQQYTYAANGIYCAALIAGYVTIDSIQVQNTTYEGIYIASPANQSVFNIIIQNCTVLNTGTHGISINNSTNTDGDDPISDCTVDNNTVHHVGNHGIILAKDVHTTTISNNTVYNCSQKIDPGYHGISIWGSSATAKPSNNIVESNTVYGTLADSSGGEGTGIQCDDYADTTIVRYNKCYDNEGHGFSDHGVNEGSNSLYYNIAWDNTRTGMIVNNAPNSNVWNNIFYSNTLYGIWVYAAGSTGAEIKNNICSENGGTCEVRVEDNTTDNPTFDNNCIYHSGGGTFMDWKGTDYNWTDWKTNSSQDASSINTGPLMTDPGNDDFTLQVGSPCINRGTFVGLILDYLGLPVPIGHRPDIGAYEHKNGGAVIH